MASASSTLPRGHRQRPDQHQPAGAEPVEQQTDRDLQPGEDQQLLPR